MSTAETPRVSFEVAVGDDGSIKVPASEVARVGLRPGVRLRLVAEPAGAGMRRSSWGVLAGRLPEVAWEDFEAASHDAIAEHEARYASGGKWDRSSNRP
ncbi:MAG: hypothetical protein ACRD0K_23250 [Egibacteraceae bacterium]